MCPNSSRVVIHVLASGTGTETSERLWKKKAKNEERLSRLTNILEVARGLARDGSLDDGAMSTGATGGVLRRAAVSGGVVTQDAARGGATR